MRQMKMIYATLLVVIYITASLMSSLSVLCCDHPHHSHHDMELVECCCHHHSDSDAIDHEALAFNAKCCDHDHELLGENHTQYIVENERDNSAQTIWNILLTSIVLDDDEGCGVSLLATKTQYGGDESLPLRAAFSRYDSLRAPPAVA